MATKPKSRTSKSNLTKKAHVPVWAIVLGLVVLVGLGAFFVFKSFASGGAEAGWSGRMSLYCYRGYCYESRVEGAVVTTYNVRTSSRCAVNPNGHRYEYNAGKNTWLCVR